MLWTSAAIFAIALMQTGTFHGDEITARTGEQWLGLVPRGDGFVWRQLGVTVRAVEDPLLDTAGEKTGKEVAVAGGSPVILVRGFKAPAGGRVVTAMARPEGLPLAGGKALELTCRGCGPAYALRLESAAPARLMLQSSGGAQILYEWPDGFSDQHCELIWAGDLDGDGRLDLVMNLSGHYNVSETTLFLSSTRQQGKLVRKAAVFRVVGC
jgi:hypothetical protein